MEQQPLSETVVLGKTNLSVLLSLVMPLSVGASPKEKMPALFCLLWTTSFPPLAP